MPTSSTFLRIGTRGSPLALAQAKEVKGRLSHALGVGEDRFEVVVIRTSGDRIQDRALSESGGKGLFTKEIDEAQLAGEVDIAVHSGKDLPTFLPDGLRLAGFLEREDPRDAFISLRATGLHDLPAGAVVGTASLRRQAMVKRLRPDLRVELLRGNVETRLRRIAEGAVDATLLAIAGLNRLGLSRHATSVLDPMEFLPAAAQGAIGIAVRADDARCTPIAEAICHAATTRTVTAERAFLTVLDGSCRTPIAAHAELSPAGVRLKGIVLRPDGSECFEAEDSGPDAEALGGELGQRIKDRLPAGFFQPVHA
jgi:hydroxymethylbilane synthase